MKCEWVTCNSLSGYDLVYCEQEAAFVVGDKQSETHACLAHAELAREIGAPVERMES